MLYRNNITEDIKKLMQECIALELDQLRMYYRPLFGENKKEVDRYIRYLCNIHYLYAERQPDGKIRIVLQGAPRLNEDYEKRLIKGFWIIAFIGCWQCREVQSGKFPTFLRMISNDNEIYDISIINVEQEAELARQNFLLGLPKETDDVIIHYAVVPNQRMADLIAPYDFDAWCTISEDNNYRVKLKAFA